MSFVAKLPKYTSHCGREKSINILKLATGLTKVQLWKEFLPDKNYNFSQAWCKNTGKRIYHLKFIYSNHIDAYDSCNNNTLSKQKNPTTMLTKQ